MTDFTLDQTRDSFLFREPHGFFDEFDKVKGSSELLLAPLLALQTNLRSAIMVAVIPFQLVYSAVLDKRFNQLVIAARIHEVPIAVAPETEDEKIARDRIAFEKANEEFALEMRDQEVITRHAWSTVNMLKEHLRRDDFRSSAQELLRQTIVMCWGALEIVAGDALRVVLNSRPTTFRSIADARPYRDALSGRLLIEALEANGFDLSEKIGDLVCAAIRIDSLEKIRDVYRLLLADDSVDIVLKNERLWRIFQQRNLIVHRRGLIDSWYLDNTADIGTIGTHIAFDAPYIEGSPKIVRDAGLAIIRGCQTKLNSA